MAKDHPGYNPGVNTQYAGNNTAFAGINKDDPGRHICVCCIETLVRDDPCAIRECVKPPLSPFYTFTDSITDHPGS